MSTGYVLWGIFLMAVLTFSSRALPFYWIELFQDNAIVQFIAKALPFPIMVILVFYSISDASFFQYPYALPELISITLIVLLHLWLRNILFSITVGVLIYTLFFYWM